MSASEGRVSVEYRDRVAVICLNRPDMGNAIDIEMAEALDRAIGAVDADQSIRCLLLTGEGRFFCVGGDVGSFASAGKDAGLLLDQITQPLHRAISRLARLTKPVVGAINGPAAGAGLGLAAIGDIVLAADSAHFTMAYTAIGLTPDGGATSLLPRLIGLRLTQELALTNRRVPADEAVKIGLISRVVPRDALFEEAMKLASTLAAGPVVANAATRNLILEGATRTLEAQLELEAATIAERAGSDEGQAGILAFASKQKPIFH